MSSKSNSNLNSSDDDAETLYQINESRPPSRESTHLSLRSMTSPTSVHSVGIEQTIPSHGYFVRARNNKTNKEKSQRNNDNSKFNEIHSRTDRNRSHRENPTPVDVEGDSARYPLTPTVVVKNPKTKQSETATREENNRNREPNFSHIVHSNLDMEKNNEGMIQQLTSRIDELTRQIEQQKTRKTVEHLPTTKSNEICFSQTPVIRNIEDREEDGYKENRRPLEITQEIPNLNKSFSTGHNRQARGLSEQPIYEQSQVAHRSEFVNDHSGRVSSGRDRNVAPWEKSGRVTA